MIDFQTGNVYFGSHLWRFQPIVLWLCCFDPMQGLGRNRWHKRLLISWNLRNKNQEDKKRLGSQYSPLIMTPATWPPPTMRTPGTPLPLTRHTSLTWLLPPAHTPAISFPSNSFNHFPVVMWPRTKSPTPKLVGCSRLKLECCLRCFVTVTGSWLRQWIWTIVKSGKGQVVIRSEQAIAILLNTGY